MQIKDLKELFPPLVILLPTLYKEKPSLFKIPLPKKEPLFTRSKCDALIARLHEATIYLPHTQVLLNIYYF